MIDVVKQDIKVNFPEDGEGETTNLNLVRVQFLLLWLQEALKMQLMQTADNTERLLEKLCSKKSGAGNILADSGFNQYM